MSFDDIRMQIGKTSWAAVLLRDGDGGSTDEWWIMEDGSHLICLIFAERTVNFGLLELEL